MTYLKMGGGAAEWKCFGFSFDPFCACSMRRRTLSSNRRSLIHQEKFKDDNAEIDPTLGFFYQPHTLTLLMMMLAIFISVALYSGESRDVVLNTKLGLIAVGCFVLLMGLLLFRDGPFVRPHPAFWRVVLAASAGYQMILIYLLYQNVEDARRLLIHIDPNLGVPLPEKSYAANCDLTWENLKNGVDEFVIAHIFGWYGKTLLLRDYWFCWILSIMFEVMEYSLQHQLPNFAECWWDHWILDVLVCNWAGIYFGMKTCDYFEMKQYSWRGFHEITSYRGKVKRTVQL